MAKKTQFDVDNARLARRMDVSRWIIQPYRQEHMRGIRRLAGNRYSPNAEAKKTYLNLLSLATSIYTRSLISENPRVMLSTFDESQKPAVDGAEQWMNLQLVKENFADTLKWVVQDSLFSIGILKVAIGTPEESAVLGWKPKAGSALIWRVLLDDFVWDTRARSFDEVSFIGHRYRVPFEVAKANPHFDKKARERLSVSYQIRFNKEGDERIGEIGRVNYGEEEDLVDMVELWEVYLPQHGVVRTLTEDDLSGPTSDWEGSVPVPLREQAWIGKETGPYHLLVHDRVSGQIFPKGPLQDLVELDEGANETYRKLMREAANLKIVTAAQASNPEDGEAMRKANDNDIVPMNDPKSLVRVETGGPHPGLFQWMKQIVNDFMDMGGNLRTMGGISPEAQTLGQEQLLMQQSSGKIAMMQETTTAYVSKVCGSMLWYYWNDPRLQMTVPVNDPRLPDLANKTRTIQPWSHPDEGEIRRTGPVPDLEIDPYSMRTTNPQQRVKDLTSIVTQVYIPMASVAEKQGVQFDFDAFLGILAKYLNMPDLQSILKQGDIPPQEAGNTPDATEAAGPTAPQQPPRENIRRSLGGAGRAQREMEANNALSMSAATNGHTNGKPQ